MCEEIALNIHTEEREYHFKGIYNFRDLGGYGAKDRRIVAWNRLYRSGELRFMTKRDLSRIRREIRPGAVIDLRDAKHVKENGNGLLDELEVNYYNIPLTGDTKRGESSRLFTDYGEKFLHHVRLKEFGGRVVGVLELLSVAENYPVIFHCNAGKFRTGIVAAVVLGILGVSDEDIVGDYLLSASAMENIKKRMTRLRQDPDMAEYLKDAPEYNHEIIPDTINLLLGWFKDEYGSIREYARAHGADERLFSQLEKNLLTRPPGTSGSAE